MTQLKQAAKSYLIFSSFEVGGWPFKMAEILNRHGIRTYYLSIQPEEQSDHDSKKFHYGNNGQDWELSFFTKGLSFPEGIRKFLKEIRNKYNITNCFATGYKSYILRQASISYIYWSYGSDLDEYCFAPLWDDNYPLWKRFIKYPIFLFSYPKPLQMEARMSIYNSDFLIISHYQAEACRKLKIRKELVFLPHILKKIEYDDLLRKKKLSKKMICEKINASHFMFSSVRHIWCGSMSVLKDNKANDIILKAYKRYLEISNDAGSKLVLVEKGEDVEASKSLAIKLGIEHSLIWVKQMPRDELDSYYQGASLCFGQFNTPVLTYSVLESIAFGTPCISYYEEDNIRNSSVPYYEEMPPVIGSRYPDKIADHMYKLISDKKAYDDLSYKSWLWAKTNCSEEKFVQSFLKLFKK